MAQLQANRTLSGSFASVWVDGALIAELESITVKVKLQRERVLPKTRTVKRGDTLWAIACELYGDGTRWREIAKKNGVTEPRKLPVGKVLVL